MARLATIPHVPIERVAHATGEKTRLQPGSFVNVQAAEGIFADGPDVVVQLAQYDWRFSLPDHDDAALWAKKLDQIARR